MGVGAVLEPLVVIVLLLGGTWINRASSRPALSSTADSRWRGRRSGIFSRDRSPDPLEAGIAGPTPKDGLLSGRSTSPSLLEYSEEPWRKRQLGFLSWRVVVTTPNTAVFQNRLLSRLLRKLPFLVEVWYWALVYWVSRSSTSAGNARKLMGTTDVPAGSRLYRCHPQGRHRRCG